MASTRDIPSSSRGAAPIPTPFEMSPTVVFGPVVQQSTDIEIQDAQVEDAQAEDQQSPDNSDDSMDDHTPIAVLIRSMRTRRAMQPFTPSDY